MQRENAKQLSAFYREMEEKSGNTECDDSNAHFEIIEYVINKVKPKKMLGIARSNDNYFPLSKKTDIPEFSGQDISAKSFEMIKGNILEHGDRILCNPIANLDFAESYFDLIISNRALHAIKPSEITSIIAKLCIIAKHIYFDESKEGHDYAKLMKENGFVLVKSGVLPDGKNAWALYKKA